MPNAAEGWALTCAGLRGAASILSRGLQHTLSYLCHMEGNPIVASLGFELQTTA